MKLEFGYGNPTAWIADAGMRVSLLCAAELSCMREPHDGIDAQTPNVKRAGHSPARAG